MRGGQRGSPFCSALLAVAVTGTALLSTPADAQRWASPRSAAGPIDGARANPAPPLPVRNSRRANRATPNRVDNAPPSAPATPSTPPPDVWSDAEIGQAQALCKRLLRGIKVNAVPLAPVKKGRCGDPAPLKVTRIGAEDGVAIVPAATLNCRMIAALHRWITGTLQDDARRHFGAKVVRVSNLSAYSCRNRYNRRVGRLSEHGRANALDIGTFTLSSGRRINLLRHWGAVRRDLRAAQPVIAPPPAPDANAVPPRAATRASKRPRAPRKARPLARPGAVAAPPDVASRFLNDVHANACAIFGTVLGPESNDAHRNHFHFDMAPRRRSNYCR
ncbi:MAG: extensin family protein [Pseudomonadota bacterium]